MTTTIDWSNWTSSRIATDEECRLFLRDWRCVCAECKICTFILRYDIIKVEEEE